MTFFSSLAIAQESALQMPEKLIPVTSYTTKNGLVGNNIQDVVQDDEGFLWIATQKGLSRFDSIEFVNFSKDKSNPDSLPDILIEELINMSQNQIWMSVNDVGIVTFDKTTQKFSSIKNNQSKLFTLPNNNLYGIDKDQNNNIWFSLYGEGVYQWNVKQKRFFPHMATDKNAWLNTEQ
ncbi:MAG TPA: hypothetical protein ENJ44_07765, partial [Oceanospirillales bacterium]|nr:hypothetical protein [Oceanospirillales bacterium]